MKFKKWECDIDKFSSYSNGRPAIVLIDSKDKSLVAVASVNLPDEPMSANEVGIKDYSENQGMLKTLIDNGIISQPLRFVDNGFVVIPICKII